MNIQIPLLYDKPYVNTYIRFMFHVSEACFRPSQITMLK